MLPERKLRFSTPAARTLHVKHKHPSVPLPIPKDVNTLKNKRYRPTYGKKGRALELLREGFFHFCFTPEGKGINHVARLVGVSHSIISRWSRKVTAEKILANAAHCETSKGKSKGSGRTPAHPKVVFACGFVVFDFAHFDLRWRFNCNGETMGNASVRAGLSNVLSSSWSKKTKQTSMHSLPVIGGCKDSESGRS